MKIETSELCPGMFIYSKPTANYLDPLEHQHVIVVDNTRKLFIIPVSLISESDKGSDGLVWRQMYRLQGEGYYTTWKSALMAAGVEISETLDVVQGQYTEIQKAIRLAYPEKS